jgi:hypothetical protein
MKLFKTLAVTFFSLGLFAVQLPATAASKQTGMQVTGHKVAYKKAAPAEPRKSAYQPAGKKKSNFFQRMASKPKEFFQRHASPIRTRNEGVPPEAYANVPRPVVEASVF